MNEEKEVSTESNIISEPMTAENIAEAWKVLNGIKVVEDKYMPQNMLILVNGEKEIQGIIDLANEETKLHERITELEAEIDKLRAENERLDEKNKILKDCLFIKPLRDWVSGYWDEMLDDGFGYTLSEREKDLIKEWLEDFCEFVSETSEPIDEFLV